MFSPTLNNLLFQRTLFGRERYLKRFSTIDKVESTDVSKWHFSELTAKLMERRSTPCWKLLGLKRLFCVASAYDPETMFALCAIAPRRQPPGPAFLRFTDSSRIHRPGIAHRLHCTDVPDLDKYATGRYSDSKWLAAG